MNSDKIPHVDQASDNLVLFDSNDCDQPQLLTSILNSLGAVDSLIMESTDIIEQTNKRIFGDTPSPFPVTNESSKQTSISDTVCVEKQITIAYNKLALHAKTLRSLAVSLSSRL